MTELQSWTQDALTPLEAEEMVIGIALYQSDTIGPMRAVLAGNGADFGMVRYGLIWDAILSIYDKGAFVDRYTLSLELQARGQLESVGGMDRLFYLEQAVLSTLGASTYAEVVQRYAIKRAIILALSDIANSVVDPQLDALKAVMLSRETLDKATQRLKVSSNVIRGDTLISEAVEEFEDWVQHPQDVRGYSCGLRSVDTLIGGFEQGRVIGVLAETSMGKSTLVSGWARNFAKQGRGLVVPTETPGKTFFHKMALDLAGIPYKLARSGNINSQQHETAHAAYADIMAHAHNIECFDDSAPTLEAVHAKILQMQAGSGCHWLIIDSGSKFAKSLKTASTSDSLYRATTLASGFMQDMARLGLFVVSTWQIGRSTKERGSTSGTGKEPTLHDAKDSGAVEEDVDILFGLYRHDYFVKRKMADADERRYTPGTAKLILLKDRAGSDGDDHTVLGFAGGRGFTDNVQRIDLSKY